MKYPLWLFLIFFSNLAFTQDTLLVKKKTIRQPKIEWTSEDDTFSIGIGGQLFLDYTHPFPNAVVKPEFLSEDFGEELFIRSARTEVSGQFYGNTEFKLQLDFAGNKTSLKDAYIGFSNIPAIGGIRVGHIKEPFRYSVLTSGRFLTFMHRPENQYFIPSRSYGILLFNDFYNKRLSAQLGAFLMEGKHLNKKSDGYAFTGRITGLPVWDETSDHLLHLGLSMSFRQPKSKTHLFKFPEGLSGVSIMGEEMAGNVKHFQLQNAELLYLNGSFSVQSEYLLNQLKTESKNLTFSNFYTEISWILTGEHKTYRGSYQGSDRVIPNRNLSINNGGWGALELALRFSSLELDEDLFKFHSKRDWTVGVNWYLNPNSRLMMNYVFSDFQEGAEIQTFAARLQVDF